MTFHQLNTPKFIHRLTKMDGTMNIKDVADISRLPAKTIRYYEDIGLIRPLRADNG